MILTTLLALGLAARLPEPASAGSLRFESGRHTASVWAVARDPGNGDWISVGQDKAVRRWHGGKPAGPPLRFATGETTMRFTSCAVSARRCLAVGDSDTKSPGVWLYDLAQGEVGKVRRLDIAPEGAELVDVLSVAFSADGKLLAAGDSAGGLHVWETESGRSLVQSHPAKGMVYAVAFAPTGTRLAYAVTKPDMTRSWVGVLDASQGTSNPAPPKVWARPVQCLDWPAPKTLIVGGAQGSLETWGLGEEAPKRVETGDPSADVLSLAHSADGKSLLAGTSHGELLLFGEDAKKPRRLHLSNDGGEVLALGSTPDGRSAVAGLESGEVCEIEIDAARKSSVLSPPSPRVTRLRWSSKGEGLSWKTDGKPNGFDLMRSTPSLENPSAGAEEYRPGGASVEVHDGKVAIRGAARWQGLKVPLDAFDAAFLDESRLMVAVYGGLWVYDGPDNRKAIPVSGGQPTSLARSPDGKRVAVGFGDGLVRIYATPISGLAFDAPLASLYVGDGEWVAWQESTGLYDSSVNGDRIFGFQVNRKPTELADFVPAVAKEKEYRRPGLLSELLAGTTSPPPATNIAAAVTDAPAFKMLGVTNGTLSEDGWAVPGETATVRVRLLNRKRGQKVTVRIGRGLARDLPGILDVADDVDDQPCAVTGLQPGQNLVRVYVDGVPIPGSEFVIKSLLPEAPGKTVVLAIGVGKYSDPTMRENGLPGPTLDAQAFAQALRECPLADAKPEVKELLDEQATRKGIVKGFDWLKEIAGHSDRVVVFIASHGDQQADATYITPSDYSRNDRKGTGLEWHTIQERLKDLDCKSIVLFTDSCHAGAAVDAGEDLRANGRTTMAIRSLGREASLSVFAACTTVQTSKEYPDVDELGKHGLFTYAVLQGLRGAIKDQRLRDGEVTDVALRLDLADYMKKLCEKYNLDQQTPSFLLPPASEVPISKRPTGGRP